MNDELKAVERGDLLTRSRAAGVELPRTSGTVHEDIVHQQCIRAARAAELTDRISIRTAEYPRSATAIWD